VNECTSILRLDYQLEQARNPLLYERVRDFKANAVRFERPQNTVNKVYNVNIVIG
jgi:hypothetical protein